MANKQGEYLVPHPKAASLPATDLAVLGPRLLELRATLAPRKRGAGKPRGFGMDDVTKILALYLQYKPAIDALLSAFKKKPEPAKPEPAQPQPEPPGMNEPEPTPAADRRIASAGVTVFWVARKNQPFKEGGGRYLIADAEKNRIVAGSDPLQAGDRVCYDVTPKDQNGVKFKPGDAANEQFQGVFYEALGMGEIQQQDPEGIGYDPTPVVFVPWKGVKPGDTGEVGLKVRFANGVEAEGPKLRVKAWAAGPRAKPKAKRARR
jgi:hypothetical protein